MKKGRVRRENPPDFSTFVSKGSVENAFSLIGQRLRIKPQLVSKKIRYTFPSKKI
jgi:hypothetical protein